MSKIIFLFLSTFVLILCVPRIRQTNYDEAKLDKCLNKAGFKYDSDMEELRQYYDALRTFLFNKKSDEFGYNEEDREKMGSCFEEYGLKIRTVSPARNCYDVCEDKNPGQPCNCPRY